MINSEIGIMVEQSVIKVLVSGSQILKNERD